MAACKPNSPHHVVHWAGPVREVFANGLPIQYRLPKLRIGYIARWPLAMRLWFYLSRTHSAGVSRLRFTSPNGPLLRLRSNRETSRTMRLTDRCIDLSRLLVAARWLTTSQIHRRFFGQVSADAARKRLRKLTQAKYLTMVQENKMSEALFRLGPEGKRILEKHGAPQITLDPKRPQQLEHFVGVNDLRVAAELAGSLSYFFAYWELPRLGWRNSVIPDAVFSLRGRSFAAEFDRGVEGIRSVLRAKVAAYERGLEGFPLEGILIVADRKTRMESMLKIITGANALLLFTTIDLVRERGLLAPIFFRQPGGNGVGLF